QHVKQKNSLYQVPILMSSIKYNLPSFEQGIKYDAFFEIVWESLPQNQNFCQNLCVDIYGSKEDFSKYSYLASTNKYNYKIIKSFGLDLKPQELNLILENTGNQIYLYDLSIEES